MSARADNAARDLLAQLVDATELESAPIDDVRADLALFGVDSSQALHFSRRLAEQTASPAAALLAGTLAAEDDDREVAALETADIGAAKSQSAASSAIDHARRAADGAMPGASSRRRSRRLWYGAGAGGAGLAIAASLLIMVSLPKKDDLRQAALAPAEETLLQQRALLEELGRLREQAPVSPAPAKQSGGDMLVSTGNGEAADSATRNDAIAEIQRIPSTGNDQYADSVVTAALILQPDLAPEPLRQSDLAAGGLTAHLPEVAKQPEHAYIIALLTLESADGTTVDGVLLGIHAYYRLAPQASEAEPSLPADEESRLTEPLGARPTLRQLLGKGNGDLLFFSPLPAGTPQQN